MNKNRMKPVEAANYLGVTLGSLNNMRTNNNGPDYYRLAGIWYKQSDLDTFIESRKVAGSGKSE